LKIDTDDLEDKNNEIPQETLLDLRDGLEFAPAEGQIPISLFFDKNAEEQSFPSIFAGYPRMISAFISYIKIIRSELQRRDRRAVRPDHLLYVLKKIQLIQVQSSIQTILRMSENNKTITVGLALDNNFMSDLQRKDEGYQFLRGIVGSPPYWETQKANAIAMNRQFGKI
jgi:hypothetical protein